METQKSTKLVIVTEELIRDEVLKMATEEGATGYTLSTVTGGKGTEEIKERMRGRGPIIPLYANVKIEIIATKNIAEKIGAAIAERFGKHYACLVYMMDVYEIPTKRER